MALKQKSFIYGDQVTIADGTSGRIDIAIDADSHFVVEAMAGISSLRNASQDLARVQIVDTSTGNAWSNTEVSFRDIFGKGDSPKYLSDPNILRPTSTLSISITNNSGAAATFYIALIGRKIYNLPEAKFSLLGRRLWFQYILDVPALTAGLTGQKATVQIFNESDFLLKKLLASEMITGIQAATAGSESAEILLNLRDTSRDNSLFNKKLAARLMFGQVQGSVMTLTDSGSQTVITKGNGAPYTLKKPMLLMRNGLIEGEFDNKANSTIAAFKITLEGIRIFDER